MTVCSVHKNICAQTFLLTKNWPKNSTLFAENFEKTNTSVKIPTSSILFCHILKFKKSGNVRQRLLRFSQKSWKVSFLHKYFDFVVEKTVCETCAGKKRKGEQRQQRQRRSLWGRKIFRWILAENFWFQVTVLVQIKLFQCPSTRLLVYKAFEILQKSHVWTFPQFRSKEEAKTKTMSRDFGGSSEAKTKGGQKVGGKKSCFWLILVK